MGYPTAFIIAPIGLLAFTRPGLHRRWGKIYLYAMVFLYCTGTYLSFAHHDWTGWTFYRNLAFNFFGFSLLFYAWRAIWLFSRVGDAVVGWRDRALACLLTLTVFALVAVGAWDDIPLAGFAIVGAILAVMEWRDLASGVLSKAVLYRRHQRYILGSYFYVLTVVSLVHLDDELPRNVKWLWPSVAGILTVALLTLGTGQTGRTLFGFLPRGALPRYVITSIVVLSAVYGGYAIYDLIYGRTIRSA
ncbi:MAG: hypothetical protein ABTQ31_12700 [Rhizobiaceae bacterium]